MQEQKQLEFTHLFVNGFGWENTIYGPEDFINVHEIMVNEAEEYRVFRCTFSHGGVVIVRGPISPQ